MTLPSILLRVLLSLSLALGGAVPAMARTGVAVRHGSDTSTAPPPKQAATVAPMHCHQHLARAGTDASKDATATHPAGHGDGCCPSGKCDCACMHPAQLAAPGVACPPGDVLHAPVVARLHAGHGDPVLAHLIRPPNAPAALGA